MSNPDTRPDLLLLAEQARQFFQHQIQTVRTCLNRLEAGERTELIHDLRVDARRLPA